MAKRDDNPDYVTNNPELHSAALGVARIVKQIEKDQQRTYTGWITRVGPVLKGLRDEAMSKTKSSKPEGKAYNTQMGKYLVAYNCMPGNSYKPTRSALLSIMENLEAVEKWRKDPKNPQDITSLNNPQSVWKAFKKSDDYQLIADVEAEMEGTDAGKKKKKKSSKKADPATMLEEMVELEKANDVLQARDEELMQEIASLREALKEAAGIIEVLRVRSYTKDKINYTKDQIIEMIVDSQLLADALRDHWDRDGRKADQTDQTASERPE
jgi:hypothetical protein